MTLYSAINPYPIFLNQIGTGLNGGAVYIGAANQDPQTNPIAVYWDDAGSTPATQPLDTIGGYIVRAGTPAQAYPATDDYSIRVRDRFGSQVFYATSVSGPLANFIAALASTSAGSGADLVGNTAQYRATRTAMASALHLAPVILTESGREGTFVWSSSNHSASVTLDTLQGIYVPPASDTTGASGAWVRVFTGPINIRWFGAVSGTAVGDQKPAIQCAGNVARGSEVFFPIGQWRIDSGLVFTSPINFTGDGMGAGPGATTNSDCSQIIANFTTGDMLKVTSLYSSTIRGLQFNTNVSTRLGGAAIHLSGDGLGSTGSNSIIEECAFNGQYEDILLTRYVQARIEKTYHQAWAAWAIRNETTGAYEPGGGFMAHNYFFGDVTPATTQSGCVKSAAGYLWFHHNMVLGGQIGLSIDVSEYDLGFPLIESNSFEEQDLDSIYVTGANSKTVSMLDISNNEFSVASLRTGYRSCIRLENATFTIENADIESNIFRCNTANASFAYVSAQKGNRVRLFNNTVTHLSGNGTAIFQGGAGLASGTVSQNSVTIVAGTIAKYSGLTNLAIFDTEGVLFADLPACIDGSVVYCSDGTFANPVAGAGTGCHAKRLNGAWRGD